MNFNEFDDAPLDGRGFDAFEGDAPGGSQLNNPLGLSDKDMQLQYDNFPDNPKSAGEGDEPSSRTSRPDTADEIAVSSTGGDDEPATDEPELANEAVTEREEDPLDEEDIPIKKPAGNVSARALIGSDSEDDGPQDTFAQDAEAGNPDYNPSTAGPHGDADSDGGGSIKSELDPRDMQLSDFDVMMEQKREERRRSFKRRKNGDQDLINDFDERIQEIITDMKKAAEDDRKANQRNECAFNKLKMLPVVVNSLQKQDLQTAFLDCGILSALADWLAPLPDGNLTHLKIRESILKLLGEMSGILPEQLKNSGIGKAVMLLYKHPKEMKENRAKAGKLIQEWSRPIFGTSANYKSMSREEREDRDMELMNKRRESLEGFETPAKKKKMDPNNPDEEEDPNKEIPRARVPQPSLKDYVIRPKSTMSIMDAESAGGSRRSAGPKPQNRFEKRIRGMKDQSRSSKSLGNHVSVAGAKM